MFCFGVRMFPFYYYYMDCVNVVLWVDCGGIVGEVAVVAGPSTFLLGGVLASRYYHGYGYANDGAYVKQGWIVYGECRVYRVAYLARFVLWVGLFLVGLVLCPIGRHGCGGSSSRLCPFLLCIGRTFLSNGQYVRLWIICHSLFVDEPLGPHPS